MRSARILTGTLFVALAMLASVGSATVVQVSGGSASALATALTTGSAVGDIIEITDSATYDFTSIVNASASTLITSRTLRAATGAAPVIFADPSSRTGNRIFDLNGTALNPASLQGLTFTAGNGGHLVQFVQTLANVTVLQNTFNLDKVDVNSDGRAIWANQGGNPNLTIDQNLFRYSSASTNTARALLSGGGEIGELIRNNVFDFANNTGTNARVLDFGNQGGGAGGGTTVLNNTFIFSPASTSTAILSGTSDNAFESAAITNNILINADTVYRDFNVAGEAGGTRFSSVTFTNNLYDNVGAVTNVQVTDTITSIGNITGAALLGTNYAPSVVNSPAVNAGLVGANYGATDFYGGPRVLLGRVDIGAVEFIPEPATLSLLGLAGLLALRRRR